MQTTGRVVFEMFFHERLPAGAPLLLATYTVHSRGFAGRSSASSSDSECCMNDLMYLSAVQLIAEVVYTLRTARWHVDLLRKLNIPFVPSVAIRLPFFTAQNISMSGFSRDGCSMFVTNLLLLWRRTPVHGVSSANSSLTMVCQHNTGRQRQANFPTQGGGKFCFQIWWKCTSKRAQQFLFV